MGIYALAMAQMVFPESPKEAHATMKSNGEVDESFHMLATYTDGRAAFLSGAFNQVSTPVTEIVGCLLYTSTKVRDRLLLFWYRRVHCVSEMR